MNFSVQKLLAKIEKELSMAKLGSSEREIREKVYSIKVLCELILDEAARGGESAVQRNVETPTPSAVQVQPVTLGQPKKLEMNEEANGDSLLDF